MRPETTMPVAENNQQKDNESKLSVSITGVLTTGSEEVTDELLEVLLPVAARDDDYDDFDDEDDDDDFDDFDDDDLQLDDADLEEFDMPKPKKSTGTKKKEEDDFEIEEDFDDFDDFDDDDDDDDF